MVKKQIKVDGMHCHGCEMLIKLTLTEMEGVKEASANHTSGIVEVEYDESKVSIEEIYSSIEKAGYSPRRDS